VDLLVSIVPTPDVVNGLPSEVEQLEFIKAFRALMRVRNVLMTYSEFTWDDVKMSAQRFEDFKSTYLDLYEDTKEQLIEKFINEQMPKISSSTQVKDSFDTFWREEQIAALDELCETEGLYEDQVQKIISDLNFTGQTPLREAIVSSMENKPKILERKTVIERVTDKIMKLVRTFEEDIGG